MAGEITLIPYVDSAAYMVFVDDEHLNDIPFHLVTLRQGEGKPLRRYTREEALSGVSHPGCKPGPEHCIPDGYATHTMTHEQHKASLADACPGFDQYAAGVKEI